MIEFKPIKLVDLDARFLKYRRDGHRIFHTAAESIDDAEGVMFLCPLCFQMNGGSVGTHSVICWSPKVPDIAQPGPGRWRLVGTGIHDLSLEASSSSVQLLSGCKWHGFVKNGYCI